MLKKKIWLYRFVTGHKQQVHYQDSLSDWQERVGGVAQGTLLGPLIFLSVIGSTARDVNSRWKHTMWPKRM